MFAEQKWILWTHVDARAKEKSASSRVHPPPGEPPSPNWYLECLDFRDPGDFLFGCVIHMLSHVLAIHRMTHHFLIFVNFISFIFFLSRTRQLLPVHQTCMSFSEVPNPPFPLVHLYSPRTGLGPAEHIQRATKSRMMRVRKFRTLKSSWKPWSARWANIFHEIAIWR